MGVELDVSEPACIFGTLAAAAVAKFAFGYYTRWQKLQRFEVVGKVSALNVFPVKSCAGMPVDAALCSRLGLRVHGITDRHWMIVKPNGDFLSQRQIPKMALIKTRYHDGHVILEAPGMTALQLPVNPKMDKKQVRKCRVWEWTTEGLDCGQSASDWISKFLGDQGLRLLFSAPGLDKREACEEEKPWGNPALPGDQSAFSDFCAYMLLSEESLASLNSKLKSSVTMKSFRPNIVIKTKQAFDEDTWQEVRIGETAHMRMLDPCTRCTLTTVDPDKGEKRKDSEPLSTLKSFRCFPAYGASPIFGVNGAIDTEGNIKVGDPVYALRK